MKTILIILLLLITGFAIYWHLPRFRSHWLRRSILTTFGINPGGVSHFYRSNRFLGFVLHFNAFAYELNLDHMGVYLVRRPWHGLFCRKFFYPMHMVKLVNITEYFGRIAKIHLLVDQFGCVVEIPMKRFFSVEDARLFYKKWILTLNATIN